MLSMILLGLSFSAPIGPVSAEAIRRGLIGGFMPAFKVKFGAAIGDLVFLIAAFYGMSMIATNTLLLGILSLSGGALLLYIGIKNIIKAIKYVDVVDNVEGEESKKGDKALSNGLQVGFGIAVMNPFALAFWLTIFTSGEFSWGTDNTSILLNVAYLFIGILLWDVILAGMLEGGKRIVNAFTIRLVTGIAGCYLTWIGMTFAFESVTRLMG
ncbi:LysE family translocator [Shewanella surugensis]|uniref:LysE family transporter n=1 Tax=Shewanella surugensis TaxID=212020 RepID=A0ABT0LJY6_9GAMM|nr:LysE family transporter [Shewanella surugensis]MCL1127899.1 LysE family transporter [Shewanella surugensis]